jgi:XRE family transcriptional regulator, fatty acid utilization regulator
MSPDMRKLGRRIQGFREARGLSQEALAAKAGLSRGYLARVETGRHEPSLSMLEKLAKVLKVKLAELLR